MADEAPVQESVQQEVSTPSFDAEAFKSSILADIESKKGEMFAEVSEQAKRDIVEKLVGKKEDGPYVPKSYEELMEKTIEKMEAKLEEKNKKEAERNQQLTAEQQKVQEEWNKYWDSQLSDLEKDGFLTEIPQDIATKLAENKPLTEEEKNHPSMKDRAQLYAKSKELKEEGYRDWANLELVYHKFMARENTNRMRGEEAPVATRNKGFVSKNDDSFTFEEIRNTPMSKLARGE